MIKLGIIVIKEKKYGAYYKLVVNVIKINKSSVSE